MPNPNDNAKLVIIGFPAGFNFGFDMYMWSVGDKFRGISQIPQGIHFVYYSGPGDEFRQGFFLDLKSNDTIVRKWDVQTEKLVPVPDLYEEETLKQAAWRDFHLMAGMPPFSQCMDAELANEWMSGSSFLTSSLLSRVSCTFKSTHQGGDDDETVLWTKFENPSSMSPSELTKFYMDKRYMLDQIIDPIGELQLSFIVFLLGQNYEAFIQWRTLVEILLQSTIYPSLLSQLINVLPFQIKQLPNDFLSDPILEGPIFLIPLMADFLAEVSAPSLETAMSEKFGPTWKPVDDVVVIDI